MLNKDKITPEEYLTNAYNAEVYDSENVHNYTKPSRIISDNTF